MRRILFFIYGLSAHGLFLLVYGYMAFFVLGIGIPGMPKTVDGPVSSMPAWAALAVNLALLVGFGVQHSVMARPAFKKWWTQFVPTPIERSTYVMFSNLIMIALYWAWQPLEGTVWQVENATLRMVLWGACIAGWVLVPGASLMINHFDLFGTRQVWLYLRSREYTDLPFRTPMLYNRMRHPLYVGWLMAFWITPSMSVGHLLFTGVMTVYIFIALRFEERDLVKHFGHKYTEYRDRVPSLIPRMTATAAKAKTESEIRHRSSTSIMVRSKQA